MSLFLLFSFSRKIKWKKKKTWKLWKFCFTWNSEKDEIQLTISCARTRWVEQWTSMQLIWKKKYFYNNAMHWWWCISIRTARPILEFLKYWFHFYYYYYQQHTTMVSFIPSVWKHSSYTFGKTQSLEKGKRGVSFGIVRSLKTRIKAFKLVVPLPWMRQHATIHNSH